MCVCVCCAVSVSVRVRACPYAQHTTPRAAPHLRRRPLVQSALRPDALRDQVPAELIYVSSGQTRKMNFHVQVKFYSNSQPKRFEKARKHAKRLEA